MGGRFRFLAATSRKAPIGVQPASWEALGVIQGGFQGRGVVD